MDNVGPTAIDMFSANRFSPRPLLPFRCGAIVGVVENVYIAGSGYLSEWSYEISRPTEDVVPPSVRCRMVSHLMHTVADH